jgi:hypothetical protein
MPSPFSSRPDTTFLVEAGEAHFRIDLRHGAGRWKVAKVLHAEASHETPDSFGDFLPGHAGDQ